jgi:hypothetical protein
MEANGLVAVASRNVSVDETRFCVFGKFSRLCIIGVADIILFTNEQGSQIWQPAIHVRIMLPFSAKFTVFC